MEEEFVTYADAKVMLANTTYERAEAVAEEIRALEHVTRGSWTIHRRTSSTPRRC